MNRKFNMGVIWLTAALLFLSFAAVTAETFVISKSLTVSKGDSKYNGMTYDMTGMKQATGNVVVNIADAEVTSNGLRFLGFSSVPDASIYALNVSMANVQVTDATITLQGCVPRYSQVYFSNTKAIMNGTTPLFLFTDVTPQYYVVINIVDTSATWPEGGKGGDLLQIGKTQYMNPRFNSALYLTRANAYNAANIWNVAMTRTTDEYFVNIGEYSMVAIDYVNCYNCTNAFVYSSNSRTPPIVGSGGCYVRYSNCTQTGGAPFYAATSWQTFSFGPQNGNIVFSGITTDGPFFQFSSGCIGQVKRYTMMAFMHINAKSSGILAANPFPLYLREGFRSIESSHIFMGNVTFATKTLSSSSDFEKAYLKPKYIVDAYSRFIMYGTQHSDRYTSGDYTYSANDYTAAYCAMGGGVKSIGIETLGDNSTGGKLWTRPQCECESGNTAPYCVYVSADPLLYYAGYTFNELECAVDNCTQCWWGQAGKCTECDTGFMLYPDTWSCVPNVCGECGTGDDDTNIYTYTDGTCVVNAVPNCSTVNINGTCVACNDGYSLFNKTCVLCSVLNCALCSTENVCYQCNTDQSYTIDSDGKCVFCGDNCKTCTASGCTACNTGYTLSASSECTKACSITGCATCASSNVCAECDSGLTLTSAGQCSCDIENCDKCFLNKCIQCADGYYYNIVNYTCDTLLPSSNSAGGKTHATLFGIACATLVVALSTILL